MGWNASDTRPLDASPTAACPRRTCSARAARASSSSSSVLDIGRIGVAAMGVGLAQGALDEALAYAKERQRVRPADLEVPGDPGQARRHGDRDRGGAAARSTRRRWLKDQGRTFTLTAAQAKLKTGRLAVRCAEEAVQIHGGYGYIEEYPVCRFYRDAKILTIGEGTDEVQQMVIARALGQPERRDGSLRRQARIREVGPRDGFQNEPEVIPTEDKVRADRRARAHRPAGGSR